RVPYTALFRSGRGLPADRPRARVLREPGRSDPGPDAWAGLPRRCDRGGARAAKPEARARGLRRVRRVPRGRGRAAPQPRLADRHLERGLAQGPPRGPAVEDAATSDRGLHRLVGPRHRDLIQRPTPSSHAANARVPRSTSAGAKRAVSARSPATSTSGVAAISTVWPTNQPSSAFAVASAWNCSASA